MVIEVHHFGVDTIACQWIEQPFMQFNFFDAATVSARNSSMMLLLVMMTACGGSGSAPQQNTDETDTPALKTGPEPLLEPAQPAVAEADNEFETETAVEKAIRTGDARWVEDDNELLDATLASIEAARTLHVDTIQTLFNLQPDGTARDDGSSLTDISWDPTHDAATLLPTFGENANLLYTNSVTQSDKTILQKSIGIIGETDARYLVLGGNPMRNHRRNPESLNPQMHQLLQNSMSWLTNRDNLASAPFNITIANMDNSFYFPDQQGVREWLDDYYPDSVSYNEAGSCDDAALASCLTDATDLLVISQHMNDDSSPTDIANTVKTVANTVTSAMADGIPVLYLHLNGNLTELGAAVLATLQVSYEGDNYWKRLQLEDFDVRDTLNELPADIASVETLLGHLRADDFAFDWSLCTNENCSAVTGLETEVENGADTVRTLMNELDTAKRNIFNEPGFTFQKLLALTGDHLRQSITLSLIHI